MPSNKPKKTISDSDEREFQQMSKDIQKELQKAGHLNEKGEVILLGPPLQE